ncbi:MAG TPA: hypothetical protein VF873_09635 [Gemmatimonadales bacterium]
MGIVLEEIASLQAHAATFGLFLQGHAATRFAGSCRHQREGRDESLEFLQGHAADGEQVFAG